MFCLEISAISSDCVSQFLVNTDTAESLSDVLACLADEIVLAVTQ